MGMIGGGAGAFIGVVHRMAASLDGQIELVCGSFSSDPENSKKTGEELFLDPQRVYATYQEMLSAEASLPEDVRMDFVSIVTPNHLHFEPATLAMQQGFAVVLDKPLCISLEEALQLRSVISEAKLPFALTHVYTGYPMVKQARVMIAAGELGAIRKVMVEYPQGWLAEPLETQEGQKQATWKTDPSKAGQSGCFGDIGIHVTNLAETVTGLKITEVLAETKSIVPGRVLEDDVNVLFHMDNGATGSLGATQIAAGEENDLRIRVYGELGGLDWCHRDPSTLQVKMHGRPCQRYRAGCDNSYLHPNVSRLCRTPSGHPEGFIEAFANIYRNFASVLSSHLFDTEIEDYEADFPGIEDGVRGMALIEAVIHSATSGSVWTKLDL